MASQLARSSQIEAETMRKVTLRIIPFLMIGYLIALVDRVNAGVVIQYTMCSYSLGLLPLAALSGVGCIMLSVLSQNPKTGCFRR